MLDALDPSLWFLRSTMPTWSRSEHVSTKGVNWSKATPSEGLGESITYAPVKQQLQKGMLYTNRAKTLKRYLHGRKLTFSYCFAFSGDVVYVSPALQPFATLACLQPHSCDLPSPSPTIPIGLF